MRIKEEKLVIEPAREIPVVARVEVVVAGGGPAGFVAAVAAARNGVKVLLVERFGFLGGNAAMPGLPFLSFLDAKGRQVIKGISQEFVDRLVKVGGATDHIRCPKHVSIVTMDPEMVKYKALEMVTEAKVSLLLHSLVVAPILEDDKVKGIIVENKSGRQAILADMVIDATGDGDVAARAGVPFEKGSPDTGVLQPMTLMFRMGNVEIRKLIGYVKEHPEEVNPIGRPIERPFPLEYFNQVPRFILVGLEGLARKAKAEGNFPQELHYLIVVTLPREGEVGINAAKVLNYDATDVQSLTSAEIEARKKAMILVSFFQRYVPGFEKAYLLDTAASIGIRETRRIRGEYILTKEDVLNARRFADVIAQGAYPIDIHRPDGTRSTFILLEEPYHIPYRCLLPKSVDNLIVAGRPLSTSYEAHGSTRVMPICMAVGQAAGTAGALAIKNRISPKELSIHQLQETLLKQGTILY